MTSTTLSTELFQAIIACAFYPRIREMWIRPRSFPWFEMVFVASSTQTFPLLFTFAVAILECEKKYACVINFRSAAQPLRGPTLPLEVFSARGPSILYLHDKN